MDALELFRECLRHPEKLVDEFYCHDELIIPEHPDLPAMPIMRTWTEVRDRITAAKVALRDGDWDTYDRCVKRLDDILLANSKYTNFLEFTSFFPVMDVSFSMYLELPDSERVSFLETILQAFIEKRHDIYEAHGYSAGTIQVRKDFEKHKLQGNFAKEKIRQILGGLNYREAPVESGRNTFCFIDDAVGMHSLEQLREGGATWYGKWSANHQDKHADVIFRGSKDYYICEAKHVKEGGGGQDKQIAEIISFVNSEGHDHGRPDVCYVSFLDGVYFNKFESAQPQTKIHNQRAQIEAALAANKLNYFINTYGLHHLLRAI